MTTTVAMADLTCPVDLPALDRVQLGHGSGGKLSAALLKDHILPAFGNPVLDGLGDGAVVPVTGGTVVLSTDTFVVRPFEFPGGNIGSLAVYGTINDLAMMGGSPRYLTAGLVLEEGLPLDALDRILAAMRRAAEETGVLIVAGDTKVVERGRADGLYVNTTGLAVADPACRPAPDRARPGDAVLLSGPIGRHGMAIMAAREDLGIRGALESDAASLLPLVERLRNATGGAISVLRDPTRGGLASALNEIASASRVGIEVQEAALRVPAPVQAACEMLGLDPLYVANEGVLVAIVPEPLAAAALVALQGHSLGADAAIVGRVVAQHPGFVALRTPLGGSRIVDLLPGDHLPRIC